MKLGSLFSGYGGLDLAVEQVFGAETTWVCDFDKGPGKILAHRFSNVPNLVDVTKVDWATVEPVDIIAGGSPCQDVSVAGKRLGMKTGTRSGLWESMREAIAVIKPAFVVWENVKGALSAEATSVSDVEFDQGPMGDGPDRPVLRALGRVLGDLSDLGYDAQWCVIRASDVGAPHHRARVFVLAHRRSAQDAVRVGVGWRAGEPGESSSGGADDTAELADTTSRGSPLVTLPTPTARDYKDNAVGVAAHRPEDRDTLSRALVDVLPTPNTMDMLPARDGEALERTRRRGDMTRPLTTVSNLRERVVVDLLPTVTAERPDARKSDAFAEGRATFFDIITGDKWGKYAPAIRRWETVLGRVAPSPVEPHPKTGKPQLSARFTEWMMGLPDGWITDTPGLTRAEAIKACGNGVVPQQAAAALRMLLDIARKEAGNGMVQGR